MPLEIASFCQTGWIVELEIGGNEVWSDAIATGLVSKHQHRSADDVLNKSSKAKTIYHLAIMEDDEDNFMDTNTSMPW